MVQTGTNVHMQKSKKSAVEDYWQLKLIINCNFSILRKFLAAVQNRIQAIDELTIVTAVKLINSLNDTGETRGVINRTN